MTQKHKDKNKQKDKLASLQRDKIQTQSKIASLQREKRRMDWKREDTSSRLPGCEVFYFLSNFNNDDEDI